jgi:hypothetical protein
VLAVGPQTRFSANPFVLLISDRPSERAALERAIALVMDCRAIPPGAAVPHERPHLIILDLPPALGARLETALNYPGPRIPRLLLVRGPG